jgi:hypothetical protein
MSRREAVISAKPAGAVSDDRDGLKGALKIIGGSKSDHWNKLLANQAVQALWIKNSDSET